jgi:spermidine/putrescine transport system substrate-binding protein
VAERDLPEYLTRISTTKVNRRSFLAASGLIGGSAFLAACTSSGSSAAPSAGDGATTAPAGGESAAPPAGDVEKDLFMYNWSEYVSPDNIESFKAEFGVDNFVYDTFANNEELIAKLQGGASGYDVAAPTAEYVPGMVEEGFLAKLDLSRIPNAQYIDPVFKGLPWDPNDEYQIPKDFGTTGILYRKALVPEPVESWQDMYDLTVGKYSGKTVFVDSMGDVFVMPLKMLGKSLNSVEPADLEEARKILLDLAPHILALDSDTYQDKLSSEEAVLCLGWTGPIIELRANPDTADTTYVVPSEGSLFWQDSWVIMADAPHPNAAYAFVNYIQQPDIQALETEYNGYATPNTEARKLVSQELLDDPAIFPPEDVMPNLEGAVDTSGNNQRIDIWQEFKSKIGG